MAEFVTRRWAERFMKQTAIARSAVERAELRSSRGVSRSQFRFVCGEPTQFRSIPKGPRSFSPGCGTQLTFEYVDFPDEIDVTTCSLDDPDGLQPLDHTYVSSKLSWVKLADHLPEYPEGSLEP